MHIVFGRNDCRNEVIVLWSQMIDRKKRIDCIPERVVRRNFYNYQNSEHLLAYYQTTLYRITVANDPLQSVISCEE